MNIELPGYISSKRQEIDAYLRWNLSNTYKQNPTLHQAIAHAVFGIGKRVRPILTIATAELYGQVSEAVLPLAASIELVHVSSCILDDLPSIDNSAAREGKPCTHILFGEAVAVLASIALLSNAYDIIATPNLLPGVPFRRRCFLATLISDAIGRMTSGQLTELLKANERLDGPALRDVYSQKTGSLFETATKAGAIFSAASAKEVEAIGRYGRYLGVAYQLTDDIRDGKRNFGSSEVRSTYRGIDELASKAVAALRTLSRDATRLSEIGSHILNVKSEE